MQVQGVREGPGWLSLFREQSGGLKVFSFILFHYMECILVLWLMEDSTQLITLSPFLKASLDNGPEIFFLVNPVRWFSN